LQSGPPFPAPPWTDCDDELAGGEERRDRQTSGGKRRLGSPVVDGWRRIGPGAAGERRRRTGGGAAAGTQILARTGTRQANVLHGQLH
jgi:hypothetical protein